MNITEDRESFAAQRRTALEEGYDTLVGPVTEALEGFGAENWFSPILQAAVDLWERTARDLDAPSDAYGPFISRLTESLGLTTEPTQPPEDAQVNRIANWVATYAINDSTLFAIEASDDQLQVEWVTMRDDDVRDLHRPLDGQRRALSDRFQVGQWELRYPGEPVGDPEAWINCRCVIRPVEGAQMSAETFATDMQDTPVPDEDLEAIGIDPEEFPPMVDWSTEMTPVPIHGVLVDTTEETGDNRHLAGEFDVLGVVDGPVPLRWVQSDVGQHDGAVRVATIDETWREGDRILYNGHLLYVPAVDDVFTLLAEGRLGLSVDLDSAVFEVDESGDEPIMRYTEGRIRAATLVDIPALTGAWAELGSWDEIALLASSGCEPCMQSMLKYRDVAAAAPNDIPEITKDAPGWITHPRDTSRLRNYWATGPGAGRIAWGTPGDFNRCRANLAEYVQRPDWLAGLCANIHFDALGYWPGQHRGRASAGTVTASAFTIYEETNVLPAEWFTDPELTAPTPVTVTPEGRVFGHIAQWGVCHTGLGLSVGMDDTCTAPPNSPTNYAYYRTGVVDTDQGEIPVGNLTMGIGHAPDKATAGATIAHYDNVNAVVADVVTGEDEFGIWFSGAMRPNLTDDQVREFKASTLSGDWRMIGGELELVAALAVNVPGFPIPRLSLAASAGRQISLVAAGMVPRTATDVAMKDLAEPVSVKEFAKAVREEMAFQERSKKARAKFRKAERKRLAGRL